MHKFLTQQVVARRQIIRGYETLLKIMEHLTLAQYFNNEFGIPSVYRGDTESILNHIHDIIFNIIWCMKIENIYKLI